MDGSTPGFPILHHLLEFAQIHVLGINDTVQPSRPLSPPSQLYGSKNQLQEKKIAKLTSIWKLNNMVLNSQWITELNKKKN